MGSLRVVTLAGSARKWVTGEYQPLLFLGLLLVAAAAWLTSAIFGVKSEYVRFIEGGALMLVLAYVLIESLRGILAARHRIVIDSFASYVSAGNENLAAILGQLLSHELRRLPNLYLRPVEEPGNWTTQFPNEQYRSLTSTVVIQNVGASIVSAVTVEAKVSAGPIQVPVGLLMALVGRLAQGPRLNGAIYATPDGGLTVLARLSHHGQDHTWRAEADSASSGVVRELAAELAARIFTDLSLGGTHPWRATAAFVEGVRDYQHSSRTRPGRLQKLRFKAAERRFLEAISEDDTFPFAWYNLALVYWHQNRCIAAKQALLRAVHQHPDRWEPHYALARLEFLFLTDTEAVISGTQSCEAAIESCERAGALTDDPAVGARVFNVRGLAQRRMGRNHEAVASWESAARLAWRALLRACWGNAAGSPETAHSIQAARELLGSCLASLAVGRVYTATPAQPAPLDHEAVALMRLAIRFSTADDDLHFELGRIYERSRCFREAISEYRVAAQSAPKKPLYRARLARVYAKAADQSPTYNALAFDAALAAFGCPSRADEKTLELVAETFDLLGEERAARHARSVAPFRRELTRTLDTPVAPGEPTVVERLAGLLDDEDDFPWRQAMVHTALGKLLVATAPQRAAACFTAAIGMLEPQYSDEVRAQSIRAHIARSYLTDDHHADAIREASHALVQDPLNWLERKTLGEVFFARSDYDDAREAWELGLYLSDASGDEPLADMQWSIGLCHWRTAVDSLDRGKRREAVDKALVAFTETLQLVEDADGLANTHYRIGRLLFDVGRYEDALPHLQRAQGMVAGHDTMLPTLLLGEAYLACKDYKSAEPAFNTVISQIRTSDLGDDESIGDSLDHGTTRRMVLAWSLVGLASALAERDTGHDAARGYLMEAGRLAENLKGVERDRCRAACAECEGWIAYLNDDIGAAIEQLGTALALAPDARTYARLAEAYLRQLEGHQLDEEDVVIRRAQRACNLAADLDVDHRQARAIDDIRNQLAEVGL